MLKLETDVQQEFHSWWFPVVKLPSLGESVLTVVSESWQERSRLPILTLFPIDFKSIYKNCSCLTNISQSFTDLFDIIDVVQLWGNSFSLVNIAATTDHGIVQTSGQKWELHRALTGPLGKKSFCYSSHHYFLMLCFLYNFSGHMKNINIMKVSE